MMQFGAVSPLASPGFTLASKCQRPHAPDTATATSATDRIGAIVSDTRFHGHAGHRRDEPSAHVVTHRNVV